MRVNCVFNDLWQYNIIIFFYQVKRYQCTECEYGAFSATILRRHTNSVHLKIKPHKCPDCSYCAASPSHIKRHIERNHTNQPAAAPYVQKNNVQFPPPKMPSPPKPHIQQQIHVPKNIMEPVYSFQPNTVVSSSNGHVMMESAMNLSNNLSNPHTLYPNMTGYMTPNIQNALNLSHNSYMEQMQAQQIFNLWVAFILIF